MAGILDIRTRMVERTTERGADGLPNDPLETVTWTQLHLRRLKAPRRQAEIGRGAPRRQDVGVMYHGTSNQSIECSRQCQVCIAVG
jgi:hypothetical protein